MKYSLIQIVQRVLSSMDSDAVNSIGDSYEATQVASIVEQCFNNIVSRSELPIQDTVFTLTPSNDPTKPTVMYRPPNVVNVRWIQYNTISDTGVVPNWTPVSYLPPADFATLVLGYASQTASPAQAIAYTVTNAAGDQLTFYALNYVGPTWYTSYDDTTVLFDSYDATVDDTIQASKMLCHGQVTQVFQLVDSYIPPLEDHQFAVLINEAKQTAHAELKQAQNAVAASEARKQWIHMNHAKRSIPKKIPEINKLPNYGRHGGRNSDLQDQNMINAMKRGS